MQPDRLAIRHAAYTTTTVAAAVIVVVRIVKHKLTVRNILVKKCAPTYYILDLTAVVFYLFFSLCTTVRVQQYTATTVLLQRASERDYRLTDLAVHKKPSASTDPILQELTIVVSGSDMYGICQQSLAAELLCLVLSLLWWSYLWCVKCGRRWM